MSKTQDDLRAAFAGEAQANRRYLAFAQKAESENRPGAAKLFRAAAEGETIHALNHFRNMGETKDTAANLKTAIAGETYESETMYPEFLEDAQIESAKGAERSFSGALAVEKIHQALFKEALARLEAGEDAAAADYWICPVCGLPAKDHAPEKCPVCQTPGEKFYKI